MPKYRAIYVDHVDRILEEPFSCVELRNVAYLGRQAVARAADRFRADHPGAKIHRGRFSLRYILDDTGVIVYPPAK